MQTQEKVKKGIFLTVIGTFLIGAISGFGGALGTEGFGLFKQSISSLFTADPSEVKHMNISSSEGKKLATDLSELSDNPSPENIWGTVSARKTIHIWFVPDDKHHWEYQYNEEPFDWNDPASATLAFGSDEKIVPLGIVKAGVLGFLSAKEK